MPSSPSPGIDLNADVGEGPGEELLYGVITSANIACGGHAGDDASMRESVRLALSHGVAIGAHVSYPDRAGFGRVSMTMPRVKLAQEVARQIDRLSRLALEAGTRLAHVKPHGALYNDAAGRIDVAEAVADGVLSHSADLVLVGLADSVALRIWKARGLKVTAEGFADRAYRADGTLVPRSEAGALIADPPAAAAHAVRLASSGRCDSICVHGDSPGAAAIARAVRHALEEAGFAIRAFAG